MNEIAAYQPTAAVVRSRGGDYILTTPRGQIAIKRDIHFGKIPGTDKPSLYKSGAEHIIFAYGFIARYQVESSIEDLQNGFFFYRFKCLLIAPRGEGEIVVAEGVGSANTRERRNGMNSGFDAANNALKMAKKRAMVDAALMVGQLSDMFTQDLEDDKFMERGRNEPAKPDDPITSKQRTRIFAIAGSVGISTERAKEIIKAMGYAKTADIKQKDYDAVCEAIEKAGESKDAG